MTSVSSWSKLLCSYATAKQTRPVCGADNGDTAAAGDGHVDVHQRDRCSSAGRVLTVECVSWMRMYLWGRRWQRSRRQEQSR